MQHIMDEGLRVARAQFDKLNTHMKQLELAQKELLEISKLGALIQPNDVIEASSKMVAGGIDPHMVASELSQMPQVGGEPLQGWVNSYLMELAKARQAVAPIWEQARHALGMAGLGVLAGHHFMPPDGGGAGVGGGNALAGGVGAAGGQTAPTAPGTAPNPLVA